MTYYCPVCRTPLVRIAEYTFWCVNCRKKVGALANENNYGKSILDERLEFKSDCEKESEQLKQVIEEFVENQTLHNLWKLRTVLKGDDVE